MPRIYVQFPELTRLGEQCTSISKQLDTLQSDVQHTVQRLDWDVKFQDDIYSTGRQIARRLKQYTQALARYQAFLADALQAYRDLHDVQVNFELRMERTPIFNGTNGYGGDQGDMSHSKNGVKFFWWVFGEDKEIYDFIRQQPGFEHYSEQQIHDLIDQINNEGCGYVALVNTMFWEFPGTEAEFEQLYGFPMRDKDGNYNFNKMLIDLYCKTDDKYFLTEDAGKAALINDILLDYEDKPEEFERIYGVKYVPSSDEIPAEVSNAILNRYDGEVASYQSQGTTTYSQENRLKAYLHQKGIDADVTCETSSTMSIDSVRNSLESGTVVKLGLTKGAQLCDESGTVQTTLNGGHAVIITGVTEDGRYIISSWGEKYYVDPSHLYTDPNTGERSAPISSYLSMNVYYK